MNNDYVITSNGDLVSAEELKHWGIRGMKWGVRRYQNEDGSLTKAGRKRYTNPDGSLNDEGKKYIAKERERIKAEKEVITNRNKTDSKFEKLSNMRKENENLKNKKTSDKDNDDDSPQIPKKKSASEMDDKELQAAVNRLNNEKLYKTHIKDLGYDVPKTEMDFKIEELKKQKEYLQLQKDINELTPKKVSKLKKFMENVIEPAASEAGKKLVTKYLTDKGTKLLDDLAKEQTAKVEKAAKAAKEAAAKKEARKEARAAKKQAKEAEKQAKKQAEERAKRDAQTVKDINEARAREAAEDAARADRMLSDIDYNGWKMFYEQEKKNRS